MKHVLIASVIVTGLWTATAFGQAKAPDWVQVTDHAAWKARDSQGEWVFKDQLWIIGGWYDSFHSPPRDVWSSSDGKEWKMVQADAPMKHSDLAMTIAFKDKMWFMGGWYNGRLPDHSASNEVWSSSDGVAWQQVTSHADWTPRIAAGIVVFKDKLWILGGCEDYYFGTEKNLKNDVWSSSDAEHWKLETADAGWAPRGYHQAVVLGDKIYVMGGGNYQPKYVVYNDVWSSSDGVHWQQETANAPWPGRIWFSSVVYRDRMWVLGGWTNNPSKNWDDVWYSKNGKDWSQLTSEVIWKERHEHSAFVLHDKIWVAGGMNPPLNNDVWSLDVPANWFSNK